jgi:hypothetical protein
LHARFELSVDFTKHGRCVDVESCLYTTMRVSPQKMHTYGGIFASKNKSTQIHTADTFLKFAHTNLRVKKNSKNIAEDQGQSELHTMSSMSELSQAQVDR